MIENLKTQIILALNNKYPNIKFVVEEPKDLSLGDLAIPLFEFTKKNNLRFVDSKLMIDNLLKEKFKEIIKDTKLVKGFLNLCLNKSIVATDVIENIIEYKEAYAKNNMGLNRTVVIDFSSPNIAKPFSVGHLRSTIIGYSLSNIYEKCGYKVIKINHLGDWGTQFGGIITAYKKWGNYEKIKKDPINELLTLYVKFNSLALEDNSLKTEGKKVFNELEKGNKEYISLWKWFKEESLQAFKKMYVLLGVKFDYYHGESFYSNKIEDVVKEIEDKDLLHEDNGAKVVYLEDMIPALIKKSDGSTLYITRDLAALFYRKKTFDFDKILYVVGNEQTLHLKQLKALVKKMGYDYDAEIKHISFGLVLQDGKKMSTRKGRIVKLETVLNEAIFLAKKHIEQKNPYLVNKEEVAKAVGVSAIIFNDLKNHRNHDVEFNLEKMLQYEGNTGPYLQYTSVRINSILNQVKFSFLAEIDKSLFYENHFFTIIRTLDKFQKYLEKSLIENDPSIIAKYALLISTNYNKFYSIERIIAHDEKKRNTNIIISYCVKTVLDECMRLLGMNIVDEM